MGLVLGQSLMVISTLLLYKSMQIRIFECTGIMGQDLVHPYIQSTTVLCDRVGGERVHTHHFPATVKPSFALFGIIHSTDISRN